MKLMTLNKVMIFIENCRMNNVVLPNNIVFVVDYDSVIDFINWDKETKPKMGEIIDFGEGAGRGIKLLLTKLN